MRRVEKRNNENRADVINNCKRQQKCLERQRHAIAEKGKETEHDGDVGGHGNAPSVRTVATDVERHEEQRGSNHSAERSQRRCQRFACIAQLAVDQLTLYLQTDDEEEHRHEQVVDPMAEIQGQLPVIDDQRRFYLPERFVAVTERTVGPQQCKWHHCQQQQTGARFGAQEIGKRPQEFGRVRIASFGVSRGQVRCDNDVFRLERTVVRPAYLDVTQRSYDAIATSYEAQFRTALDTRPLDRALLKGFAEMTQALEGDGAVLEVGSGPGTVSAFLRGFGVHVQGIDLSPNMVQLAQRVHSGIEFRVGDMRELPFEDAMFNGVVAWYSIIHLEPQDIPVALREFHRVLRSSGLLLLAFQQGDAILHFDEAFGHDVDLDFRRLQPEAIKKLLADEGFDTIAELIQAPDQTSISEKIPQAFIVAQKR